jgi:hypothetical protein
MQGFYGKAKGKETTRDDNIKIDLREIEWGGMDRIDLNQDRGQWRAFVNTVMKFRIP